ncbi:MAG: hypothetical protein ACM3U1_04795 [Chloroflexota bacterium]
MAKKEKELSPDAAKQKEIEDKKKLREKLAAAKKKRMKELAAKERKRIRQLINLPFKLLFLASSALFLLGFISAYFSFGKDLTSSLLVGFFIFSAIYFGGGVIMVGVFLLISKDKELRLEEQIRIERESAIEEEKRRQEEEMAELANLEQEIAKKRFAQPYPIPPVEQAEDPMKDSLEATEEFNMELPDMSGPGLDPDPDDEYLRELMGK